jgi:hypothetical protein
LLQEWWPPTRPPLRTNTENSKRIYLGTPIMARSALIQRAVRAIWSGSSRGKPLSHRFVGEEAISALTGLHCKTKLHSAKADSVPTLQCKRGIAGVRERSSEGRDSTGTMEQPRIAKKRKTVILDTLPCHQLALLHVLLEEMNGLLQRSLRLSTNRPSE